MTRRMPAPEAGVTGVASGSLGTGTALDDTQLYEVDALAVADHPDELAADHGDDPVAEHAAEPATLVPVAPVRTDRPTNVPRIAPVSPARSGRIAGYPTGVVAGAVIALVVVAAVLAMRDGLSLGGSAQGPGFAGAASFPPPPSFGAFATVAPEPTKAETGGHGHGHGHGH